VPHSASARSRLSRPTTRSGRAAGVASDSELPWVVGAERRGWFRIHARFTDGKGVAAFESWENLFMLNHARVFHLAVLVTCCSAITPVAAATCDGPRERREASSSSIKAFIRARQMTVLTFGGYSGAQYEDPQALIQHAARVLDERVPAKTLINIGATAEGIGAVYEIAKQKGFTTMGIVSTLARDERIALSKCVDYVFFVKDSTWGGQVSGTNRLSPTSAAIVESGTSFVAIGGGDVTRDEMLAARRAGKSVTFIPADMNHKVARERAQKRGEAEPTDFRGSAHGALANGT